MDWATHQLGDLCDFQRGLTYAKGDEVEVSSNVVLRATNIDLATNLLNLSELRFISEKVLVPDSKKVKKGSLIICTASGSKSHLGKVAFVDDDYGYAFGGFMGMLTPKRGLLPKYLFHLMTSDAYRDFIGALSDGANINNLKFDDLKLFKVPYPPLPEQQRIVALLEDALGGLAIAKANAEKNLQNARALFESHLQSVFSNRGKHWPISRIGDLTALVTKGTTPTSIGHAFTTEGVNFLKIESISEAGHFIEDKFAHISPNCHRVLGRSQLQAGDILFSIAGALGRAAITTEHILPANTNQALAIIRLKDSADVLPQFVLEALKSGLVLDQVDNFGAGAAQQNLSLAQIRELQIALPRISEQKAIVRELSDIRTETVRLADIYAQKIDALAALKSSLLHTAFAGELH